MTVEYSHYLLPQDHNFRPSPEKTYQLMLSLRENNFIIDPQNPALKKLSFTSEEAKVTGAYYTDLSVEEKKERSLPINKKTDLLKLFNEKDITIKWPISSVFISKVTHPMDWSGDDAQHNAEIDPYFDLELILSNDFQEVPLLTIEQSLKKTLCSCGQELEYQREKNYICRIRHKCPSCNTTFDPEKEIVPMPPIIPYNPPIPLKGGTAHRFAIVIHCSNAVPRFGSAKGLTTFDAKEDFIKLCEKILQTKLYEMESVF